MDHIWDPFGPFLDPFLDHIRAKTRPNRAKTVPIMGPEMVNNGSRNDQFSGFRGFVDLAKSSNSWF